MVLVTEHVHPKSLDFANQKKVVVLRDVKKLPWTQIQKRVRNLQNKKTSVRNVGNVYRGFNTTKARKPYSYHKISVQHHTV